MTVGVLTFWHWLENYGSQLQCYALQQALIARGHNPFLIQYPCAPFSFKEKVLSILRWILKKEYRLRLKAKRLQKFEVFRAQQIRLSSRRYYSFADLRKYCPMADAYVVGSDQVWNNLHLIEETKAWFLDFTPKSAKCLSYAVSLTSLKDEKKALDFVKPLLQKFLSLSFREQVGVELCCRMGRDDAQCVCDPTLLLRQDDYLKLADESCVPSKPYLLVYVLNIKHKDEIFWDTIEQYAKDNHLEIVLIAIQGAGVALSQTTKSFAFPTIPQFLGLMHRATAIVTNSYHGSIFALQMERPFVVLLQGGAFQKTNSRVFDLLNRLELDKQICLKSQHFSECLRAPISWHSVSTKIQTMRQHSFEFIQKSGL